jgi:two-component SAPR family response regulator
MADKSQVLQIFAFGPPEVRLGEHLVTFPTRKTLALLIYLAIEAVLHPRDLLATMFWPEATTERSHASLRNTLNHLQIALRQASDQAKTAYLSVTRNSSLLHLSSGAIFWLGFHWAMPQNLTIGLLSNVKSGTADWV